MARNGVRGRAGKTGSARARAVAATSGRRAERPGLYRGARIQRARQDIYTSDHSDQGLSGRFRWLISTCLAGAIGALAIVVVVYGSADPRDSRGGFFDDIKRLRNELQTEQVVAGPKLAEGLKWFMPRADKLEITSGATSTRYIIHEVVKQKRTGREYINVKPYMRMMLRMAPVPKNYDDVIPQFDPLKLYRASSNSARGSNQDAKSADVSVRVVELLGGILPGEDGQELDQAEVAEIVGKTAITVPASEAAAAPDANAADNGAAGVKLAEVEQPFTSILHKSSDSDDVSDELEGLKRIIKTAADGDTLSKVLISSGAPVALARGLVETAREVFADTDLKPDYEVHIVVGPSLDDANRLEPVRFSVFDEGHAHKVTVSRTSAGEFAASADQAEDEATLRAVSNSGGSTQRASLFSSLYAAALMQQIPTPTITQILTTHAHNTDFKLRIRPSDTLELFFDVNEDLAADSTPGDLLFTSLTAGGKTTRFYRFRTPNGETDFYDENGNTARRFLMRQPVQSARPGDVRLTSGYGERNHPLLNRLKMHTGIDWAAPPGTPIMAAGTGTVDEAGRKGQYGNYVRVKHVNDYQTAYGHMSRIADGVYAGAKVRQGQIIGYVGSTGLSSGPHLHFEVLVKSQHMDPARIDQDERRLEGKDLEAFQIERARIDELKARPPVATSTKSGISLNK
jgi:murein DD-endopeptidase MepM/ murein hydrolase activator NlpD